MDDLIERVGRVISENPDKAQQAASKPVLAWWFVGQVQRACNGKANSFDVYRIVLSALTRQERPNDCSK